MQDTLGCGWSTDLVFRTLKMIMFGDIALHPICKIINLSSQSCTYLNFSEHEDDLPDVK